VSAVIGLTALRLITPACAGDFTAQEQRGRQLYREGGYGTNITATLGQESLSLPATKVPCASCHGPDGLGRPEAGVVPSDITWANLTKPYGLRHDNGRSHPSYTADSIIRAVTSGVDPAGNILDRAMPRYTLDGTTAEDLVAYLKRLGSDDDRGVGATEIAVAAVVPGSGQLAGIGSVVGRLLSAHFDRINRDGGIYNRQIVLKAAAFDSSRSAVDALQRLMSETEVFAVVAPVVFGQDAALAEFSERAALPVVGPLALYRRSERQDFTFYLTASLDDQVRVLVKYAQNQLAPANSKIAIVSSDNGAGLAIDDAIRREGRNAEWTPALSLQLRGGTAIADIASQLRREAVNIIFYDGGADRLVAFAEEAAQVAWQPAILTVGQPLTRESLVRLQELDARVFAAYPLLGSDQSPDALERLHSLQADYGIPAQHLPMQAAALVSARVLIEGLQRVGRDLTRAKFVAALAALQNLETGLMRPISFGPNRRTGVRGAHVVALGRGRNEPEHVWISLD
jgi:ABC-type branched-subunit amino acid transport system substrate-binding protein